MAPDTAAAFLAAPASRGATVVVLGGGPPDPSAAVIAAIGPTGLLVVCAPDVAVCGAGVGCVLAAVTATPMLSHAADLALVPDADGHDAELLVEEVRRVLAPRGAVRLVTGGGTELLVRALHGARFREVEVSCLLGSWGVGGIGPA